MTTSPHLTVCDERHKKKERERKNSSRQVRAVVARALSCRRGEGILSRQRKRQGQDAVPLQRYYLVRALLRASYRYDDALSSVRIDMSFAFVVLALLFVLGTLNNFI